MNVFYVRLLVPLVFSVEMIKGNFLVQDNCGVEYLKKSRGYKVFGGKPLERERFPWIVRLESVVGQCTGALISQRHVLTASHCVDGLGFNRAKATELCRIGRLRGNEIPTIYPSEISVYIGNKCDPPSACQPSHPVKNIIRLEDICRDAPDMAILELEEDVGDDEAVPVCMPTEADLKMEPQLLLVGAGDDPSSPNDVQRLQMLKYQKVEFSDDGVITAIRKNASACEGDSGGPVVQRRSDGRYAIMGVMDSSEFRKPNPCETANGELKNYFTDVYRNKHWICENTGTAVCDPEEYLYLDPEN